jgi:hypothetical protein
MDHEQSETGSRDPAQGVAGATTGMVQALARHADRLRSRTVPLVVPFTSDMTGGDADVDLD